MASSSQKVRVLIVGETVYKIHTHFKGFASYETGYCSLSLEPFLKRFDGLGFDFTFMPNHEVSLRFPLALDEMAQYDAIVISDAPADSFLLHPDTLAGAIVPNRLALLGEYVAQGGGLAMVGGWMSFGGFHGKAHYAFSPLAEILPVGILPHDDRMEVPEGCVPVVVAANHPILKGLPTAWPDFLGYNRVLPKRGETVLALPKTGDPLLIAEQAGAGRMACFTSDILPHWGSPRFLEWEGYVPFWSNLFRWLGGK